MSRLILSLWMTGAVTVLAYGFGASQSALAVATPILQEERGGMVTVSGRVLDRVRGIAVEGASVQFSSDNVLPRFQARDWAVGRRNLMTPTTIAVTDSEGRFEVEIAIGRYWVSAILTGFAQTGGSTIVDASSGLGSVRPIELLVEQTSVLTGRVTDETGRALVAAWVTAIPEQYAGGKRLFGPCEVIVPEGARQRTNERGEYRLFGLTPGEYHIAASEEACGFPRYHPRAVDPMDAIAMSVSAGLDLGGGDIVVSSDQLFRAHFESDDLLNAEVLTSENLTMMEITRRGRTGIVTTVIAAMSNARSMLESRGDNRFSLPPLPTGSYEFFFRVSTARSIGRLTFDIIDRDVEIGRLEFPPLVPIQGQLRTAIGVREVDYSDLVIALRPIENWSRDAAALFTAPIIPDQQGHFSFARPGREAGVSEGRYYAAVFGLPSDMYIASMSYGGREVLDTGFAAFASTGDWPLEVLLDGPGGVVEGTLVTLQGEPVSNTHVVVMPLGVRRGRTDLYRLAHSDSNGRFEVRGLAPGDYGVVASETAVEGAWQHSEFSERLEAYIERVKVERGGIVSVRIELVSRQ